MTVRWTVRAAERLCPQAKKSFCPCQKILAFRSENFFIHCESNGISSVLQDCISSRPQGRVSHQPQALYSSLQLDDIQGCTLFLIFLLSRSDSYGSFVILCMGCTSSKSRVLMLDIEFIICYNIDKLFYLKGCTLWEKNRI